MKKLIIRILIGIAIIGIGFYVVFYNRNLTSLIYDPESATICLVINDNIKFVQQTTLSCEETAQLIDMLEDVSITCPIPYGHYFEIDSTEPLYRLFFLTTMLIWE